MAQVNTTDVLTRINATGNFTANQKETLRQIHENTEQVKYLTANHTVNTTTSLANVSGMSFDVKSNRKYVVEVELLCLATANDGIKVALSTGTDVTAGRVRWSYQRTGTAEVAEFQTDFTSPAPTGINAAITAIRGFGYIQAAADGTFQLQSALHTDTNQATTIYAGSYIKIREVA